MYFFKASGATREYFRGKGNRELLRQMLLVAVTVIIMQRLKATVHRDQRREKKVDAKERTAKRATESRWWKRWHAKEAFVGKRSEPVVRRHLTASDLSFFIPILSASPHVGGKGLSLSFLQQHWEETREENLSSSIFFLTLLLASGLADISTSLPFRFSVENLRCTARTPSYLYTRLRSLWT